MHQRLYEHWCLLGVDKCSYFRLCVRGLFHDMAPMAPERLEVENYEPSLALRFGEKVVGPGLPFDQLAKACAPGCYG